MASLNKVLIIGSLGRDPETKYQASGDAITNISVATSYKPKDRDAVTEWHRITFFGRLAEIAGQYLRKGSSVYVEGRLQTTKYTDKDGIEKYVTNIIAENLQMLGGKPDGQSSQEAAPAPRQQSQREQNRERQYSQSRAAPQFDDMGDSIPF